MRKSLILSSIVIIAAILRFWDLSLMPISPNWDEVSHGYNAYSILKTGKDEWGVTFPSIFRAFGDFKLPFYIYLTVIPIALFGLNIFAIRLVSAVSGVLAVWGVYLLTGVLWPEKKIHLGKKISIPLDLISALLLSISPWHFFISRPALEANLALTLIIFGGYFLVKGLKKNANFLYASIFYGLSLHTYNTARVFVPAILLLFITIFYKRILFNKKSLIAGIILFIFSSVVGLQIISGEGTARYNKLQILSENAVFQIGQAQQTSKLPTFLSKAIHNRPLYFISTVLKNYLNYFSPQFLYQSRGAQIQFAIPFKNLFTLPVTILALFGIVFCLRNFKELESKFLLAWLLVSPLAASLTADPPQALRPNPMIPAVIILSVLGLNFLVDSLRGILKIILFVTSIISIILTFIFYLNSYYFVYSTSYANAWQFGYQEVIEYVNNFGEKFDKIFITKAAGEPHIFYAFYSRLDPIMLQPGSDNIRFKQSDWYWTDKIGKIYFVNEWDIPSEKEAKLLHIESGQEISTNNSLLITTSNRVPKNAEVIKNIKYPTGNSAFVITSIP